MGDAKDHRALFLDRDGIINRRLVDDYVKNWNEFEFIPEIFGIVSEASRKGFVPVVISNQRGIGRGLMTMDDLREVHRRMQEQLRNQTGVGFQAIYYCPHDRGVGCACRKPAPGMLLRAADELALSLKASWFVGDSETDVQAGRAAGVRTARVLADGGDTNATVRAPDVIGVWKAISARD